MSDRYISCKVKTIMDVKMQEAMRLLQSAREEIARLQQLKIDAESAVQEALLDMQNTER